MKVEKPISSDEDEPISSDEGEPKFKCEKFETENIEILNERMTQNFVTSNLSPTTSCPKWFLNCLKQTKSCNFKGFKVAHHLLLGNIEIQFAILSYIWFGHYIKKCVGRLREQWLDWCRGVMTEKHRIFKCDICNGFSSSDKGLKIQKTKAHPEYKCKNCDYTTGNKLTLQEVAKFVNCHKTFKQMTKRSRMVPFGES